jgi:hypothetical protein
MTRRERDSTGNIGRQFAQALTPGPDPWINSTGLPTPSS